MRCPHCQASDTQVLDTRKLDGGFQIRRRRRCERCDQRFATVERLEMLPLMVVKKNGIRERFERDKLEKGILLACYRRPVSAETITSLVDTIETALAEREGHEVTSGQIGDLVMNHLRNLDEVAYIRFASVYRAFADLGKLREAVELLMVQPPASA